MARVSRTKVLWIVAAVAVLGFVFLQADFVLSSQRDPDSAAEESSPGVIAAAESAVASNENPTTEDSALLTDEEAAEAAENAVIEAFDALVDAWMEPKEVSMTDIDGFLAAFRKLPTARRDEEIHRALNLIPDDNIMLLAGVLMDKTMEKEIVEIVFNDVLNRDESVKKVILQQIFKDKTHPCWADTAWILDVTGELPEKH